jgi:hypothetical protein
VRRREIPTSSLCCNDLISLYYSHIYCILTVRTLCSTLGLIALYTFIFLYWVSYLH